MEFIAGTLNPETSAATTAVWNYFQHRLAGMDGFLGYQWPSIGMAEDRLPSFVVITNTHGIMVCDVVEDRVIETANYGGKWRISQNDQWILSRDVVLSAFAREVKTRLGKNPYFHKEGTEALTVGVHSVLILCQNTPDDMGTILDPTDLWASVFYHDTLAQDFDQFFESLPTLDTGGEWLDRILAELEPTRAVRRRGRLNKASSGDDPNGIRSLIRESANRPITLDSAQRKLAMQLPDGPQRIRGLAGTGKTSVLTLKAALAHKNYPDFKILYLFLTQGIYQQVTDLITRYYKEETGQDFNPKKLDIVHAWGGAGQEGLYYNLAKEYGFKPMTYRDVKHRDNPLESLYRGLMDVTQGRLRPKYDLVLIDESQDFPPSVFEVVFHLTKEPKRLVWAYDEFQASEHVHLRQPEELFGFNQAGEPNVPNAMLHGTFASGMEKDLVLKHAYRNPRLSLMVAHGLVLGLYHPEGMLAMIPTRSSWEAMGYRVIQPDRERFNPGDEVIIERPVEYSHNNLEVLLHARGPEDTDLIRTHVVETDEAECAFVAQMIADLIYKDHVPAQNICVVTLAFYIGSEHLMAVREALLHHKIASAAPGLIDRPRDFAKRGAVTITTPFRAKGNEADFIFIMQGQRVFQDGILRDRRSLFMALTRSRGWTWISGIGRGMEALDEEIRQIKAHYPQFRFIYPSRTIQGRAPSHPKSIQPWTELPGF